MRCDADTANAPFTPSRDHSSTQLDPASPPARPSSGPREPIVGLGRVISSVLLTRFLPANEVCLETFCMLQQAMMTKRWELVGMQPETHISSCPLVVLSQSPPPLVPARSSRSFVNPEEGIPGFATLDSCNLEPRLSHLLAERTLPDGSAIAPGILCRWASREARPSLPDWCEPIWGAVWSRRPASLDRRGQATR